MFIGIGISIFKTQQELFTGSCFFVLCQPASVKNRNTPEYSSVFRPNMHPSPSSRIG